MIRHIIKLIWNQRRQNSWIASELLLVFVVLWYVVDTLFVIGTTFFSPLGLDINHVYLVKYSVDKTAELTGIAEGEPPTVGNAILTAAERIRNYPGVEAVGIAFYSLPMSAQSSYSGMHSGQVELSQTKLNCITPEYMDVFRFGLQEPEGITWKQALEGRRFIASDAFYKEIKEKGLSRDSRFATGMSETVDDLFTVGAVTTPFRQARFSRQAKWTFFALSEKDIQEIDDSYSLDIVLRVRPEQDVNFADNFIKEMDKQLDLGKFYLLDVEPYFYMRDSYELMNGEMNRAKNMIAGMVFLLFNIFLGITGTFWYRTQQRKGEMGLRMAVGATPRELRRTILTEGIMLLTLLSIPAIIICGNIGYMEIVEMEYMDFTFSRFVTGITLTYLLLAMMIIVGIWYPASRLVRVEPAEALHYE